MVYFLSQMLGVSIASEFGQVDYVLVLMNTSGGFRSLLEA